MKEVLARRVLDELSAGGYNPRPHEPEDKDDAFSVSIDGAGFDIDDFKTLVRSARTSASGSRSTTEAGSPSLS
jgi:hypothetical protein